MTLANYNSFEPQPLQPTPHVNIHTNHNTHEL
jgi:hypothetical protein